MTKVVKLYFLESLLKLRCEMRSVINSSETDKTAKNGVLQLCLKLKPQVKFRWNLSTGQILEGEAAVGAKLFILDKVYKLFDGLERVKSLKKSSNNICTTT